jgi:hypothetical protein
VLRTVSVVFTGASTQLRHTQHITRITLLISILCFMVNTIVTGFQLHSPPMPVCTRVRVHLWQITLKDVSSRNEFSAKVFVFFTSLRGQRTPYGSVHMSLYRNFFVRTRTEHHGRVVSTPVSYSGDPVFKSRPWVGLLWLRFFVVFFSLSRQVLWYCVKICSQVFYCSQLFCVELFGCYNLRKCFPVVWSRLQFYVLFSL